MGNENGRSDHEKHQDSASEPDLFAQIRASSNWHACRQLYLGWTRQQTIERMQSVAPGFPLEAYERELTRAMEWAEKNRQNGLRRRQLEIEEAKTLDVLNAVFVLYLLNTRYGSHYVQDGLGYIDIQHELGSLFSSQEIEAAKHRADDVIKYASNLVWRSWDGPHLEDLRAKFPECNDNNLSVAIGHAYWLNR
ncbi:hypothetical protein [Arthrobacter sp. SAFR-044]|uniref:hypothetical protein n=1 Tax=Arthrobacter sp. SAFR-044 TaxID=3387278 RepID=UPI003F7C067B